jgi:hypothetical protein
MVEEGGGAVEIGEERSKGARITGGDGVRTGVVI